MSLAWLTRRPVAHRGFHNAGAGVIENTLSAAHAAAERGFAIEVDLQLSADGEAMVFHDDTLERLTLGVGPVVAQSAAALAAIPFKATGDRIPTLQELLDAVAGRVPLVLELKSLFPRRPDDRLVIRVAAVLKAYAGPVVCMSFDPEVVDALRRLAPHIPRGIVADAATDLEYYGMFSRMERVGLRHVLHSLRTRPAFVAYCIDDLPRAGPWLARHLFGLPVLTWTVRTKAQRQKATRWADQIIFEGFDPERD